VTLTAVTHLVAMVLAGVGAIVLALFGKIPGTDAFVLLTAIAGITGTTAAISSSASSPPAGPTTGTGGAPPPPVPNP